MFSHLFSSYTSRKIVINFEVKRSVGEGGEVVTDKQHSSAILNTFAGMYPPIRRTDKQTNRKRDKQTNRQTNKHTNKQTNRQTDNLLRTKLLHNLI